MFELPFAYYIALCLVGAIVIGLGLLHVKARQHIAEERALKLSAKN